MEDLRTRNLIVPGLIPGGFYVFHFHENASSTGSMGRSPLLHQQGTVDVMQDHYTLRRDHFQRDRLCCMQCLWG